MSRHDQGSGDLAPRGVRHLPTASRPSAGGASWGPAWRLFASGLRGRRRELAGLVAWTVVEAVPSYLSGLLVALATDRGFLAHRPRTGFLFLGALAASVALGAWASRQLYRRLAAIVEPFRDQLVARTVAGVLSRSTTPGAPPDMGGAARVSLQVEIVRDAYAGILMAVQGFVITTAAAAAGLASLSPYLVPLVLVPLVAGVGTFALGLPALAAWRRAYLMADESIAERAAGVASGLRDIVAAGGEEAAAAGLEADIDAEAAAAAALARATSVRTLAVTGGGLAPLVLILLAGPWLLRRGATTGDLLGALTYVLQGILPALQGLTRQLGGTGLWLFAALARLAEVGAEPPAPPQLPAARAGGSGPTYPPLPGGPAGPARLSLTGVTFRYGAWSDPIIDRLTLDIEGGSHVAVVGSSGVGKSTLAGIMAGMLVPEAGTVLLGGTPLANLDTAELTARRVLVPQEAYVFAGSVEENLCYLAGAHPGDARLDQVVQALGVQGLIERLGGYRAAVEPGLLSAGERQLLTLARAWLSPAELIILDEATCHLDPAAEAQVEAAFAGRPGTLVVIAHRISSARRAGRVIVMDGSRVVAGTHEELIATSSFYRDLVGHWLVHS